MPKEREIHHVYYINIDIIVIRIHIDIYLRYMYRVKMCS